MNSSDNKNIEDMNQTYLRLHRKNYESIDVRVGAKKETLINNQPSHAVYADSSYEMELVGLDNQAAVKGIRINGDDEDFIVLDNRILFPGKQGRDRLIFSNYFGFATITVIIELDNGEIVNLSSEFLSIKIKDNVSNRRVEKMLEFIFEHQSYLLAKKTDTSSKFSGTPDQHRNNIESKISLAEEVLRYYDRSIGFFSANSQYTTKEKYVVDHIEKLQRFTPQTLQYISSHPEYLKDSTASGIRLAGKNLYPEKTLLAVNVKSRDIDENRAVLGFLRRMNVDLDELKTEIAEILRRIPLYSETADGYVHSSWIIFQRTKENLNEQIARIDRLIKKSSMLEMVYKRAFQITEVESIKRVPKRTEKFIAIPQYSVIFQSIYRWFSFSEYNFEEEKFILDFVNLSFIYELYVLCKIIELIESEGMKRTKAFETRYLLHENALFRNTNTINTFVFENENSVFTLYYQPVIYNRNSKPQTGIGLFRNNSYSIRDASGGTYYTPDYILRINDDTGETRYYIGDAKFKTLRTVEEYDVAETCYKYITSVSPVSEEDHVEAFFIVYGKNSADDRIKSMYDFSAHVPEYNIQPKAYLIPLSEQL